MTHDQWKDGAEWCLTCPECGGNMRPTTCWGDVCDACDAEFEAHEAALSEYDSRYSGDDEMEQALIADGEKLRQLTGEDHGPFFIPAAPRAVAT